MVAQMNPAIRADVKPEAYASYLRGRGYLAEYQRPENIDLSIAELNSAVRLDPKYANTYAVRGEAYLLGYQQINRAGDWVKLALRDCQASLALHETAEGRTCLGDAYNSTGRYDLAVQEFEHAMQIDPSNEEALRGVADGMRS